MTIEFRLPELGEDIDSGDVINVYVTAGDAVVADQALMELETDKAAIEIPSPADGKVSTVHVKEGDKVMVGELLVTIDENGVAKGELKMDAEIKADSSSKKKDETKTSPPADDNKTAPTEPDTASTSDTGITASEDDAGNAGTNDIPAAASPTLRRLARELGVDINTVKGTGPGGRITEQDLRGQTEDASPQPSVKNTINVKPEIEGLPDFTKYGEVVKIPMTKVRRVIAERLTKAWEAPHVTQHDKADITELEKVRKLYGQNVAQAGGKLTLTSIMLKIAASALKLFPQFNASIDMEKEEVIYKKYYNIGIAVETERGLFVPVIKDVDKKNIFELSLQVPVLSERARNQTVSLDELKGSTFTISNLGGLGGTYFTPVLNPPEVAILGMSKSAIEPVYIDGEFEPRLMLPLSLSYDHRLIDGADAVRFLRWIVEAVEEPFKLALEG